MTAAPAKATSFMAEREGEKKARKIYGGSHSTTRAGERERIPECGLLMHRVPKKHHSSLLLYSLGASNSMRTLYHLLMSVGPPSSPLLCMSIPRSAHCVCCRWRWPLSPPLSPRLVAVATR